MSANGREFSQIRMGFDEVLKGSAPSLTPILLSLRVSPHSLTPPLHHSLPYSAPNPIKYLTRCANCRSSIPAVSPSGITVPPNTTLFVSPL